MSIRILQGDCRVVMATMDESSIDAVVRDPPYELTSARPGGRSEATRGAVMGGFMGMKWDGTGVAFDPETWRQALRVLKPGGYLLAFSGTRTYHRMACAIEDAGFEIRDQVGWLFGCLDEQTEVATAEGIKPHHKTKIGDLVLCYDATHGEYTYQPILEVLEYDYCDTAYRLVGDFGEQVVSRNHRCIIERGGSEVFEVAETLQREARVPVLEDLHALQLAVRDAHERAGGAQQDMQRGVLCGQRQREEFWPAPDDRGAQGRDDPVCGLWGGEMDAGSLAAQGRQTGMQPTMQRGTPWCGMGQARPQGPRELEPSFGGGASGSDDRAEQSGVEGRSDVSQSKGCLHNPVDQVRALSTGIAQHGSPGRVRDGASLDSGSRGQTCADPRGGSAPSQPRCDGQRSAEPDVVQDERRAQGVRAWRGHTTAVVRVVPFQYTGKVWCLRVPTGAFVAVRNGVAFPTGNSGFPKSHNGEWGGTALKPAWEPICLARKPLIGTVEANWREHGTGALNIDACRVPAEVMTGWGGGGSALYEGGLSRDGGAARPAKGRWPANVIHDGSDEVLAAFPDAPGQLADTSSSSSSRKTQNVYGAMKRGNGREAEASADSENEGAVGFKMKPGARRIDSGSAARFFYCAKADKSDRDEGLGGMPEVRRTDGRKTEHHVPNLRTTARKNHHPTVKPTDLMRYLCRLVTPPGGLVLDPFMGSGSTLKAAELEGLSAIGIELDAEYIEIAKRRIAADMPLFAEVEF